MIVLKPVDESSYQAVLDLTVAEADMGLWLKCAFTR